jgi:hypothetical protein
VLGACGAGLALASSGNPKGQWSAPTAVERSFVGHAFEVMTCSSACRFVHGQLVGEARTFTIRVVSAQARGLGRYRSANGIRRYQLFDVRVCGLDRRRAGARVGARFVWYTRRPPSRTTTTNPDGMISANVDTGAPRAVDWDHRAYMPVAHVGC